MYADEWIGYNNIRRTAWMLRERKDDCVRIFFFRRFSGVVLEGLVSWRVEIIGGITPKVEQVVQKISQWF